MAGRYTGSYLGRANGWRAAAILADAGRASLIGRIPEINIASTAATTTPRQTNLAALPSPLPLVACANTTSGTFPVDNVQRYLEPGRSCL